MRAVGVGNSPVGIRINVYFVGNVPVKPSRKLRLARLDLSEFEVLLN